MQDNILNELLYPSPILNKRNIIYADCIATGRPSPIIENHMIEKILPYYSNTHSNAYCGINMKECIKHTKEYMRKELKLSTNKKIIFTGSGCTGAINHLVFCLKLGSLCSVNIYLTPLEHHSNYLPWKELQETNKDKISLNILKITSNYMIDLDHLKNILDRSEPNKINIFSITACSNVLGIKTNINEVSSLIKSYNTQDSCIYGVNNLLFLDYACIAPYDDIAGDICNALFFSPHKFLGGPGTPGILIADKELFKNRVPMTPGGGCVIKVCSKSITYDPDIEKKETGGTPNILGIIRIKKILQLKKLFIDYIKKREEELTKKIFNYAKNINNLIIILPDITKDRLPILCVAIKNLHYNFIVVLFNDLFSIQTRGGVSCTGILAELIEKNIT